jgi:hypothetical protein
VDKKIASGNSSINARWTGIAKKPHSYSLPASIGVFSLVENQVTFKLENVFFFTVIFARVGFGKPAFQR